MLLTTTTTPSGDIPIDKVMCKCYYSCNEGVDDGKDVCQRTLSCLRLGAVA